MKAIKYLFAAIAILLMTAIFIVPRCAEYCNNDSAKATDYATANAENKGIICQPRC